jgi:hypothetical protein
MLASYQSIGYRFMVRANSVYDNTSKQHYCTASHWMIS